MRLSNTAISMFKECPRKFQNHYLKGLRSEKVGSAFHFGSAVDEALNVLLLKKKKKLSKEEQDQLNIDYIDVFKHQFRYKVLKKDIGLEDVSTSPLMDYYKSDFDINLLEEEDIIELQLYMIISGYVQIEDMSLLNEDDKKELKVKLRDYIHESKTEIDPEQLYLELRERQKDENDAISLTDQCFLNFCCWLSLNRKGILLLKAYEKEILPEIEEVFSIQKRVNLPNEDGDILVGVIDLECTLKGHKGVFTADNKTSSTKYKKSDINDNTQLPIYDEYTENGQAAYLVLNKKIKYEKRKECLTENCSVEDLGDSKKRKCPECKGSLSEYYADPIVEWQIVTDKIDEAKKELHFETISGILEQIKQMEEKGYFPKNTDSCFSYGKRCPYYDLCRGGGTAGLYINKRSDK